MTLLHFDKAQIGYFTSPYPDAKPAYEPDLRGPCPYCGGTLDETNICTVNVAYLEDRQVSAFIYCHRVCNDTDRANELDQKVLDTVGEMVKAGEIQP